MRYVLNCYGWYQATIESCLLYYLILLLTDYSKKIMDNNVNEMVYLKQTICYR